MPPVPTFAYAEQQLHSCCSINAVIPCATGTLWQCWHKSTLSQCAPRGANTHWQVHAATQCGADNNLPMRQHTDCVCCLPQDTEHRMPGCPCSSAAMLAVLHGLTTCISDCSLKTTKCYHPHAADNSRGSSGQAARCLPQPRRAPLSAHGHTMTA
jgi:hypothetical protein